MSSLEQGKPQQRALHILLVDEDAARQNVFKEGLANGATVERISDLSAGAVLLAIAALTADILIISQHRPSVDLINTIKDVSRDRPMPIAIFVEQDLDDFALQAVRAGASGYIVRGLAAERVATVIDVAIERFRLTDALLKELSRSKSDLEARKLIERAKGLLMQQRGVSEHVAYEALRKMAMARGKPIREIAETIVAIENMLP
jgi:response regulator NasT